MNDKTIQWLIIGLLGVVLILSLFPLGIKDSFGQQENHKISVSESAEKEVMPNEAILQLSVVTEGKDPQQVQDRSSVAMTRVKEALKEAGVKEEDIETSNYNLYPWQEYDYNLGKSVDKGYRLVNSIKVTTKDITSAGRILKAGVDAGVNQVDNVAFTLSDEMEKEIKATLIAEASTKARQKAELLAKSMDVKVGDVLLLTESSYTPGIYYGRYDMMAMEAKEVPAPSINPEKVTLSVTVNVDFEIE